MPINIKFSGCGQMVCWFVWPFRKSNSGTRIRASVVSPATEYGLLVRPGESAYIRLHSGNFLNKKIVCDLFIKFRDFTHSQSGKLLCECNGQAICHHRFWCVLPWNSFPWLKPRNQILPIFAILMRYVVTNERVQLSGMQREWAKNAHRIYHTSEMVCYERCHFCGHFIFHGNWFQHRLYMLLSPVPSALESFSCQQHEFRRTFEPITILNNVSIGLRANNNALKLSSSSFTCTAN